MDKTINMVKSSMHLTSACLNTEIQGYISATLEEMSARGIKVNKEKPFENSELIKNAIVLNVKSLMDYNGKSDMYHKRYVQLRDTMALSKKYKEKQDV